MNNKKPITVIKTMLEPVEIKDLTEGPYYKFQKILYDFFENKNEKIGTLTIWIKKSNEINPYGVMYAIRVENKYKNRGFGRQMVNHVLNDLGKPFFGLVETSNKESMIFHKKYEEIENWYKYAPDLARAVGKQDKMFKIKL